jgi:ABC-type multidrug transport system fused ATPase/permease subunit
MTSPPDEVRDLKSTPDESSSVGQAMRRLFTLLDRREKRRFYWLIPAVTGMALLQVVGIASVLPFLALVTDPSIVETNGLLSRVYDLLGFQSTNGFLVFAGAAALALLVISNAFTALTEYLLLRYSWNLNHSLSVRLLREYVAKPYVFFLDQNSAALATNILSETKQAVRGFVLAALNLMSRTIVALFILALLIGLYPLLAILTFGFLGAAYAVTFMLVKRGMAESGRQRSHSDRARHQAAFEVLGGIKDIKLLGREEPFLKRYERHSRNYERQMAKQQVIALFPRYAFETIAFGGMLMIVLVLLLRGEGVQQIVPTLGVFAFATLRLLPALQSLFGSMTSLRFSVTAIDVLHRDITPDRDLHIGNRVGIQPQPFTHRLELDSIDFTYPNGKGPVLKDFSLSVAANSTVGIVGPTGSGKTTTVDILLGLLEPSAGELKVDGVVIDANNRAAWQSNLGYVPQQIYLADDTIAANIAFGVRAKDVDRQAVERAATLANIHDFVANELPEGYDTVIGERGVRLSGGQRQRLGIARALYHNPAVLVFDEATSALDGITEESIFKAVSELGKSKTIVMIAHRMTTVRECDVIYLLEKGRVTAMGSYDELIATNARFRAMARAGASDEAFAEPAAVV